MEFLLTSGFWLGLIKIVWIDITLSGDNAVVIALAARSLPPSQQTKAVVLGSGAAVALRVSLIVIATWLLQLPWLEIAGGLLLLWIGIKLLNQEDEGDAAGDSPKPGGLLAAVRTILVADLIMSLDNIIAVAAAAQGNMALLILGLAISIPLVVFGSTLIIKLMDRFPIIIQAGAALIGWVAGETMIRDTALKSLVGGRDWLHYVAAALGAVLVLGIGRVCVARAQAASRAAD
jgi:YjbE family integral membrane protein